MRFYFRLSCTVVLALGQAPSFSLALLRDALLFFDIEPVREHSRHERRAFPEPQKVAQAFEVTPPLLGPDLTVVGAGRPDPFPEKFPLHPSVTKNTCSCHFRLVDKVFANSFGSPAVVDYHPPPCVGEANTALANLTVQTIGRQFDRLSFAFLGDTEILRWSTAQPRRNGVEWTAMKDVSHYLPLWRQPQKVIFDLGNLLNKNLTGTYNVTWDVMFFNAPTQATLTEANAIIPISSRSYTRDPNQPQASLFNTIDTDQTFVLVDNFPRNALQAVVTIQADARIDEEFWYGNFPTSTALTFARTGAPNGGLTAYREIRLYIDGLIAGYFVPFPLIYSGGINPAFWQPIVGIDLFDEKEAEIDITPFLPLLCDGKSHNFTLRVFGLLDDGLLKKTGRFSPFFDKDFGSYWQLTAKIFVWNTADANFVTTGLAPTIVDSPPYIKINQALSVNKKGVNKTLKYSVNVVRRFSIHGKINAQSGPLTTTWTQNIKHSHGGFVTDEGSTTHFTHKTNLQSMAIRNDKTVFGTSESYPLAVNISVRELPNGTVRADSAVTRKKSVKRVVSGNGQTSTVFPSGLQLFGAIQDTALAVAMLDKTTWHTSQHVNGKMLIFPGGGPQSGILSDAVHRQTATFTGHTSGKPDVEFYSRKVSATSTGMVSSEERVAGKVVAPGRAGVNFP